MAFVAGAAGRAVAGRAAGGAAARGAASKGASSVASKGAAKGSNSAFGTAARAKGDPQLAAELAELNGDTPAPAPTPEPAPKAPAEPQRGPSKASAGSMFAADNRGTPDAYKQAAKYASPTVALNAGGGALLGLVAYAVGLTYLRGGRDGVKALLRAKFLNQTSAPATGSSK